MRLLRGALTLPLGVDINSERVCVVAADAHGDGFVVSETRSAEMPPANDGSLDLKIAEAIRNILASLKTRERRAILAAPPSEVVTRTFRVPPGMRRSEADRAAALEADTIVDWPTSERLVALDRIPGRSDEMLLSIARCSVVERVIAIARAGGLKPVAVDVPACAWRRAIPDADAILDYSRERAELVIFGDVAGVTHFFPPRLVEERLASQVRGAFVDARREGRADVQRLAILSSKFRYESIEELLRDDGYVVAPVTLGGLDAPDWTFAYGLASWSIAPRGLART